MPSDQILDEFGTLQLLWGDASIDPMVVATNGNATREQNTQEEQRPWKPVEKASLAWNYNKTSRTLTRISIQKVLLFMPVWRELVQAFLMTLDSRQRH